MLLLAAASSIACSCGDSNGASPEGVMSVPLKAGENARFDEAAAALRTATDVTLYEGLPHPTFERDLFESELASKPVIRSHAWPFYATPLPVSAEDASAIQAAFSTSGYFALRNPDVGKLCGGFHPDYELRWSGPRGNYEMQFCFGCNEVNLHTPSGAVEFDMVGGHYDAAGPYRRLLFGRREQRPARD